MKEIPVVPAVVNSMRNLIHSVARLISHRIFADIWRSGGSLRAQLIFWNVVALSLLVGGLGVACRFATLSFMTQSVDRDLASSVDMYLRPPRVPVFRQGRWDRPSLGSPPFDDAGPPPFGAGRHEHGPGSEPGSEPGSPDGEGHPPDGEGHPPDGEGHPPEAGRRGGHHGPPHLYDENSEFRPHHYDAKGQSTTASDKRPSWDPAALARALRGAESNTTVMVNDEPIRVFSSPAFNIRGEKGAVQVAYPLRDVYRAVSGVDTALLLMVPIGLLGVMWLGSSLTGRVLRRVHQMTQAAGEIGTGQIGAEIETEDFSRRLPVSGKDEFAELAQTFNGLLGRLDETFQAQKQMLRLQQRFTADASHELKTPLTIIKGRAGLALSRDSTDERSRSAFQEIDAATTRMAQLVQDLLLLARSDEGGMGRNAVETGVSELLETARAQSLQALQSLHFSQPFQEESASVTLNVLPETLCILGNQAELARLFRNLLDNAIRYTPADGAIRITAQIARSGLEESVVIAVEDTGMGIAPEHLPHLGERFYRVDASRTRPTGGTGLGLSICRGIVAAHNGTLKFDSAPGIGTTVTVTLPACRVAE